MSTKRKSMKTHKRKSLPTSFDKTQMKENEALKKFTFKKNCFILVPKSPKSIKIQALIKLGK
jgi:hypothetical protein